MITKIQVVVIILALQIASTVSAGVNPIQNPAANIYNPASRMDNPNPLTPPSPATPQEPSAKSVTTAPEPAVQIQPKTQPTPKPIVIPKSYNYKTVKAYIIAANKAYAINDNREFLSITEEALKRIDTGTLKASVKSRQTLENYKKLGDRISIGGNQ
jgi:hypothetical protein